MLSVDTRLIAGNAEGMRVTRVNPQSTVLESALPIRYVGSNRAVLLLHGFTGYPGDVSYLAEELHGAGFSVYVPRLPGHGTDGEDFLSSSWRDWLRHSIDAYLDLRSTYDEVCLAGLSMGGVLCAILAATFPTTKTVLLAPALRVHNPLITVSGIVGLFKRRIRSGEHEHYDDPEMDFISREYWDYLWPGQTWGLRRLQRLAMRRLGLIEGQILTIISEADETVPTKVAKIVETRAVEAQVETIVLRKSAHVVTRDTEAEHVAREVVRFLL